jgi:hypothetical protein
MNTLSEYAGQELRWVRPNRRRGEYELRAGDEALVRSSYEGAHGGRVRVEAGDDSWLIEQKGLAQRIIVAHLDTETELETPVVERSMTGRATVRFADGRSYRWQCASFWRDIWTWNNSEGTTLLQLKRGSQVQIEPAAQELTGERSTDLALLAALGWFLHKEYEQNAAYSGSLVPIVG